MKQPGNFIRVALILSAVVMVFLGVAIAKIAFESRSSAQSIDDAYYVVVLETPVGNYNFQPWIAWLAALLFFAMAGLFCIYAVRFWRGLRE